MVVKASRDPRSRQTSTIPTRLAPRFVMEAAAKTSECKHRGSYNISPTPPPGLPTSLLLFILRTIAGQEAFGDRVRSFTLTPHPAISSRWSISPFRPKSPSHVAVPRVARRLQPQVVFSLSSSQFKHQRCILRHVFAFTSSKGVPRQRDQLWSGHRG